MMWSILYYLRNNPEKLRWNLKARFMDTSLVDEAIRLDELWRAKKREYDDARHELNKISEQISRLPPGEREKTVSQARSLREKIQAIEQELANLEKERENILRKIPNVIHESVPIGPDDSHNAPVRYWGRPRVPREFLDAFLAETERKGFKVDYEVVDWRPVGHADFLEGKRLTGTEKAAEVAGSRFYYTFNDLVWLDLALTMYALESLAKKGFTILQPPLMLRREVLEGVISFDDFRDMVYKIEGEELYLIGTAEHPIAALHVNDVIPEKDLPLLYAGISPSFRKEAGAHGKDMKGIFRVHHFNKVEQFVFSHPDESWEWHERLIRNAEELWQGLGIPYRVVNIASGDLGVVAAKKYDLEAWMPAQGKYREMVSCSNCTDWQSYRLNIRYAEARGAPSKGFVHTLNSTALAIQRTITAIVENYQTPDGVIRVPRALRKYLEPVEPKLQVFVLE
ncbi:seryl-tRNA synthetase [Infirmifilum uzonense]|uniref:Serine--tRNA ligase n=2 Tax=Infirmifilum uzonense TaxID=1550241 RepID=A0A0F7FK57_9CREN|nr:seryl-tRNA synthetase [Infirmifilum uzonense]